MPHFEMRGEPKCRIVAVRFTDTDIFQMDGDRLPLRLTRSDFVRKAIEHYVHCGYGHAKDLRQHNDLATHAAESGNKH